MFNTNDPERDWDGGQYFCCCIKCDKDFIGHKRQYVCRICDTAHHKKEWEDKKLEEIFISFDSFLRYKRG